MYVILKTNKGYTEKQMLELLNAARNAVAIA